MLNIAIMTGRLTAKPELKTTTNDKVVCNFRIAVERSKRKNREKETDFFSCTAWNSTAEAIEKWFDTGDLITVVGTLQNDSYEANGEKYNIDRIIVREFQFGNSEKKDITQSDEPDEADLAAFDELLNDPNVTF